ncbi:MAG TPA: DUF4386 domain-containing protein [Pyrinomonadaceae bacterium]|nr:DUF4386 domain-containing protein [Pyrinomonadaceae bacterium]
MTTGTVDESQRKAARVVGLIYLLALVTGCFAEFYVRDNLIADSAAQTAQNIAAHERLFRLGIAANLITFAADVVLLTALYVVLRPVNRDLALLAAFWRLIETTLLAVTALNDLTALRLLSGVDYLRAFEADRLHALARLSVGEHGLAYQLGLFFFGFGSTVFCYLWYKSGYIPRALSAWGVVASFVVGLSAFLFVIHPGLWDVITPWSYVPIFFFELIVGFWLLLKGISPPAVPDRRS